MTKQEYFDQFHAQLGSRYNLTPAQVRTIRHLILGLKQTPEDIHHWAKEKIKRPKKHTKRSHSIQHYQRLIEFLNGVPPQILGDIIHLTEYDQ